MAKLEAEAHARALKALGFADDAAFKAHQRALKDAENAKLSEDERKAKALEEALKNHKTADTQRAQLEADLAKEREDNARFRTFTTHGVRPDAHHVARALYDAEKAKPENAKATDEQLFANIRKEWPNVFGAAGTPAPQQANTSPQTPPPASPFGNGPAGTNGPIDALTMTPEQVFELRNSGRLLRSN